MKLGLIDCFWVNVNLLALIIIVQEEHSKPYQKHYSTFVWSWRFLVFSCLPCPGMFQHVSQKFLENIVVNNK